jgi:hypothetical protein
LTATLVGAALQQGAIASPDDAVSDIPARVAAPMTPRPFAT